MKKIIGLFFLCIAFLSIQGISYAQSGAPNGINYQAVIRDNMGTLVANSPVAIRINIRQSSASGVVIFSEKHLVTTTQYGLVNFVIGAGAFLNGGPFATINWGNGPYFLDLGVAFSGLPNPTSYMAYGTQQMMSVPFALYARSSGNLLNQWKYGTGVPAVNLGTTGDYYLDTATGNVYSKTNGTMWILISNIMGPQGPLGLTGAQGIQGLPGPTGAVGATGPIGLTGPVGATGTTGAQGIQGLIGPAGTNGTNGAVGATGPTGLTGPAGATGTTGAQGIQGLIGPAGTNGAAGATGLTGPAGAQGIQGLSGTNGANGATGATGPIGLTGPAGAIGIQGLPGTNGDVGATGPSGAQGIQGLSGTNGQSAYQVAVSNGFVGTEAQWLTSLQGAQGIQGLQGLTGATGTQGIQGVAGPTGPVGATGAQGIQGIQGPPGSNIAGTGNRIGFSSSQNWVCPIGVTSIIIELWGGGGANGNSAYCSGYCNNSSNSSANGGTGGSGGYLKTTIAVIPGMSYSIIIGDYLVNSKNTYFDSFFAVGGGNGGNASCGTWCAITGANGVNGSVINYIGGSLIIPNYISAGYVIGSPSCCANPQQKGFVVIQF